MRNETRKNRPARPAEDARKPRRGREKSTIQEESATAKSPQYTARQREQVRKGLRILAKVIVRAHLRRQAELAELEDAN